ncbi:translocation/assembly module TamB [Photobacterium sp. CCB-ST2H9]|uniref:autotransporter assembly complex protein TamB n=1 Tax=Photobacterium sp. CCB-ST2H9 TaxID=2912855 RepID=UPI0020031F50|nr:translocation/assembly module TamB domain-containing protein [Photobacterium sp. CCB-ST2H9]UTM56992.1 translocation/assembly module TamB [Photobacterium sp. CCB-ST2H9]
MSWLKRLSLGLLTLVMLLTLLLWALLYSHAGVRLALWGAQKFVPALSVRDSSGALLKGFTLNGVRYQDELMTLSSERLTLNINDDCLPIPELCIRELTLSGLDFVMSALPPMTDEAPEPSEPLTEIALPVPVRLERLTLDDIQLNILGNRARWQHFSSAATMTGSHLTLKPTDWEGIALNLAPPAEKEIQEQTQAQAEDVAEAYTQTKRESIVLPDVVLPLKVTIERFTVKDFLLEGKTPQKVNTLELVAEADKSQVTLTRLYVDVPQATLDVNGEAELKGEYPLTLKAMSEIAMEPVQGHHVKLAASGSLAKLALDLALTGRLDAKLKGTLSPLDADLPFDINVVSNNLQWPLDDKPEFVAQDTAINAKGDLNGYAFTVKTKADGEPMPAIDVNLQGKGTLDDVDLENLTVKTLGGQVSGNAQASWAKLVNWQGQLNLTDIQPGLEWPQAEGKLSGRLRTSGGLTAQGGWYVKLPELNIDGEVIGQPFNLAGQLDAGDESGKGAFELVTQGLTLKHGPNGLSAQGSLKENWNLSATVKAPDLAQSVPGLRGRVNGNLILSGKMSEPAVDLDLTGQALGWQDLAQLKSLKLKGRVTPLPTLAADIHLTAQEGSYQDAAKLKKLDILFQGTEAQHTLTLTLDGEPVSTSLAVRGSLDRQQGWQGLLQRGSLETPVGPWRLNQPTALAYNLSQQNVTVAAHCWGQDKASVCLSQPLQAGARGQAALSINQFGFAILKPFLPPELKLDGELNATANASWSPQQPPVLQAQIRLPAGGVRQQAAADEPGMTIGWDQITLNADMRNDVLTADWLVAVKDNGDLSGNARITQLSGEQQLDAAVKLDAFRLDFLQPLVADYHTFGGQVDTNLTLSGPILHPQVQGIFKISQLKAIGRKVPLDLDRGEIVANFNGYSALLRGELDTPDGQLLLQGDANWADMASWSTNLKVNGRELEVNVPPMISMKVSPDLKISAAPKMAEISGNVIIPWGRITVDRLPESAVQVSDDEILLTDDLKPIETDTKVPFEIKTNVMVRIGPDVRLSAFGLDAGLSGNLKVNQQDKTPLVYGEIKVDDGTYRAFGQELVIRKGLITFNGPADQPYLSVEAIRNPNNIEDEVTAGIRVTGPADEPRVDIFSDPAMPQQNALSYILRGRNLDSESPEGGGAMTTALISMGLSRSSQLVGNVGEAFGVQDLTLDTAGAGDDSQVTISGYIYPGLQVKYGVGIFNPIGEFTIRYKLLQDLYVEAVSGLESAVDLLYQFEFN